MHAGMLASVDKVYLCIYLQCLCICVPVEDHLLSKTQSHLVDFSSFNYFIFKKNMIYRFIFKKTQIINSQESVNDNMYVCNVHVQAHTFIVLCRSCSRLILV